MFCWDDDDDCDGGGMKGSCVCIDWIDWIFDSLSLINSFFFHFSWWLQWKKMDRSKINFWFWFFYFWRWRMELRTLITFRLRVWSDVHCFTFTFIKLSYSIEMVTNTEVRNEQTRISSLHLELFAFQVLYPLNHQNL